VNRRAFIAGTVALLTAPRAGGAQPPGTVPRIGLLEVGSLAGRAPLWDVFRQGMRELGYVEGRTVIFEARGAEGSSERLAALAAELARLKVDVIVTSTALAVQDVRRATATIPVVTTSGNPLEGGYVASLARPGGNVTGLTTLSVELSAKRLELAREIVPGASRFDPWNRDCRRHRHHPGDAGGGPSDRGASPCCPPSEPG
jgi:putative ABC transport system substrate-binding protein